MTVAQFVGISNALFTAKTYSKEGGRGIPYIAVSPENDIKTQFDCPYYPLDMTGPRSTSWCPLLEHSGCHHLHLLPLRGVGQLCDVVVPHL